MTTTVKESLTFTQRWRRFVMRRSPARFTAAWMLLGLGAVVGLAALLPTEWLAAFSQAVGAETFFADHPLIFLCAAAPLVLVGLPMLLVPRTGFVAGTQRPLDADVLVYLDIENQGPRSTAMVKPIISSLRNYIQTHCGPFAGRTPRTAFFFFADAVAINDTNAQVFRQLYGYGFRLIDAPHYLYVGPYKVGLKDTADMLISMFAYGQGILADRPRHILLITLDHDFIPLAYQLHYMGHHVHLLWAKAEDTRQKDFVFIGQTLGISAKSLLSGKTDGDAYQAPSAPPASPPPFSSGTAQDSPPKSKPMLPGARLALQEALEATHQWWQEAKANDLDLTAFKTQLIARTQATKVGYDSATHWLLLVYAIGLLEQHKGNALPNAKITTTAVAIQFFERMVNMVLTAAQNLAPATEEISILTLRQYLLSQKLVKAKKMGGLRSILSSDRATIYLLRSAAALGKIAKLEELPSQQVQITWQTSTHQNSDSNTPPTDTDLTAL